MTERKNQGNMPLRSKMSMVERAKQFAPFSVLRGLDEALAAKEALHMREERPELSEDVLAVLNRRLSEIYPGDYIKIVYFKDGAYKTVEGEVASIDNRSRLINISGKSIRYRDICKII